jgi:hypothetical protein
MEYLVFAGGNRFSDLTEAWRKLQNEELYNLYSLPDITGRMRWWGV